MCRICFLLKNPRLKWTLCSVFNDVNNSQSCEFSGVHLFSFYILLCVSPFCFQYVPSSINWVLHQSIELCVAALISCFPPYWCAFFFCFFSFSWYIMCHLAFIDSIHPLCVITNSLQSHPSWQFLCLFFYVCILFLSFYLIVSPNNIM